MPEIEEKLFKVIESNGFPIKMFLLSEAEMKVEERFDSSKEYHSVVGSFTCFKTQPERLDEFLDACNGKVFFSPQELLHTIVNYLENSGRSGVYSYFPSSWNRGWKMEDLLHEMERNIYQFNEVFQKHGIPFSNLPSKIPRTCEDKINAKIF